MKHSYQVGGFSCVVRRALLSVYQSDKLIKHFTTTGSIINKRPESQTDETVAEKVPSEGMRSNSYNIEYEMLFLQRSSYICSAVIH